MSPVDIDDRPPLDEAGLRAVLATLGVEACEEHVAGDEQTQVTALLGTLLAATQWHIQGRQRYSVVLDASYHHTRQQLDFPPCRCGSPCDRAGCCG